MPGEDDSLAARVAMAPGLVRPGASCWDHARTPIHALTMESAYADPALLRDLGARGGLFARDVGAEVVAGAETAGVPLAASISLSADLPFAFVRKPGYRGHEIDEPPVRGADVAGRRTLLVDDAVSSGASVERFAASLAGLGAEVVGVFVLVDMRDVAETVSPMAAALPTGAVTTYLQVLELATANGLLDPALHELAVDALVNRWRDDDSRWDLLPVTAAGPSTVPLRDACPFIGAPGSPTSKAADNTVPRHRAKRRAGVSHESVEFRLATASAVVNPELLLEYQRQAPQPAAGTPEPVPSAPHQPLKENAMSDPLITALLGQDPQALTADVSLATPLTSAPITGRDAVVAALGAYADVFAETDDDLRLTGDELDGATFTTTVDGHTAQVAALVTRDAAGLIATIHMYGRPWPYMALVRQRLAEVDPALADPTIGTSPPEGPGTAWTDDPAIPPLADDVMLISPVLTGEPTGKAVLGGILEAAAQTYHDQKTRAVLKIEGQAGFAAVMDEIVEGNVLQLIEIFTLNSRGEVDAVRIFTRPWPVTAYLRKGIHEHSGDLLGPEFWGDPQHDAAAAKA